MSSIKKEKAIKTLDNEVQLVQMEKFMNDFDFAMKKDIKSSLKKIALAIGPVIISLIGFLIFKNPLIITIGAGLTGVGGITILTKDFIKDIKEIDPKNKTFKNISSINEEKNVEQILQEGIGKSKGEDFYTERYKSQLKKEKPVEKEQEKKYRQALEKQQNQNNLSKFRVVNGNNNAFLNKDETMIQIVKEIDAYVAAYNIPPIDISNNQWDLYFDNAYQLFVEKGIERKFYDLMSQIGRLTFSKSLLNKEKKIDIYDFIENLHYLENKDITEKDILNLQKEILNNFPQSNIINFNDYNNSIKK